MGEKTLTTTDHAPQQIAVYEAVRCVGTLKPVFDPDLNAFQPPELNVSGTGFWVKDYGCFVTCAHVIEDLLGVSIDLAGMLVAGGNGYPYQRMRFSIVDIQHDLALLRPDEYTEDIKKQISCGLSFSKLDPRVAEPIAYAGFPFGRGLLDARHTPTYSEGIVGKQVLHRKGRTSIQCTGPVVGGYSGSPVVMRDEPDKIIGVLANGPVDDGNTGNIFRAIHYSHVRKLCELSADL